MNSDVEIQTNVFLTVQFAMLAMTVLIKWMSPCLVVSFFVYCICLCRKTENITHYNTCWRNRVDVCIVNWKFVPVSYNVTGSFFSGIDECIDHNGHCQQLCNDTKTSYLCSCHEGFEIDKEDNRVCQGTYLLFKCSSDSFSASIGMSLW